MSALAELSIFPLDKGESVSPFVARVLRIIEASGIEYRLGPMGTCIEGEWDDVIRIARECVDALMVDCNRVYMVLKVDYRAGRDSRMEGKIDSIKKINR